MTNGLVITAFLAMLAATIGGDACLAVRHYRPLNDQINADIAALRASNRGFVADYEWWRR